MSLKTQTAHYTAPAIAAIVTQARNDTLNPPTFTVENLGTTATVALKYQESDDGTTFTDITGATGITIAPGGADSRQIISTRRIIAAHVGGNVPIAVHLTRRGAQAPSDLE